MELLNSILYDTVYHSAPIILCVIGGIFRIQSKCVKYCFGRYDVKRCVCIGSG